VNELSAKRKKLLLALAVLASMTTFAEEVILEDVSLDNEEVIALEDKGLELSDTLIDIELDATLEGLDGNAGSDNLPRLEPSGVNAEATQLMLGVKEKYTLDAQAIGSGSKVTFKSSNKKVATVTSKGVIQGVKKGNATITGTVKGGAEVVYEVQVVAAPNRVKLDKSSISLGVKESILMTPTIPDGTHASFTWSTSDKTVATVSKTGKITGRKAGKATVTVKTQNGKTAKVTVKVLKAPSKVTLDKNSASLMEGESLKLKVTLPSNTYSKITWSSSNNGVATVSAAGKVTAVAAGTATITARTFNNKKATCKVTVKSGTSGETVYRALLIGEENFSGQSVCTRNRGDVTAMTNMLNSITGPAGGSFSIIKKYDLSAKQVLSAVKNAFSGADDDDVSLFFIATHGDVDYTGDYAGALAMSPSGSLLLKDLANALNAVPGKVIVVLESCGAGAAVYPNGGNSSNDSKALYEDIKRRATQFDEAVIRAFSGADPGIVVTLQPNDVQANTGEFRVDNKFYVLTASRYQELSWGMESGKSETSYNYFTMWLTQGIGTSGAMPADANSNNQTTLDELYRYISKVGDDYQFRTDSGVYYQHVQVYPADSDYVLFCR
jgi:uncharacterized protein YjdB